MRFPRLSISMLMAVVAFVAADIAAMRATLPVIPNPGLAVMILILEAGLLVGVRRRGPRRAFWIGFEVFGWGYVLAVLSRNGPIWRLTKSLYESHVLGRPILQSSESLRFLLAAGVLQLVAAGTVALAGGWLARSLVTAGAGRTKSQTDEVQAS